MPSILEVGGLLAAGAWLSSQLRPGGALGILKTGAHLRRGAQLLSDDEILQMKLFGAGWGGEGTKSAYDILGNGGGSHLRRDFFDAIQNALSCECLQVNASGCENIPPSHTTLTTLKDGQIGLSIATQGFAAAGGSLGSFAGIGASSALGTALGAATFGIGAALGVFAAIYAHHAAAVARERRILCASVPAANDSLQTIEAAVMDGTISPIRGQQLLAQLADEFRQTVSPILKMNPSQCNAACVWISALTAVLVKKQNRYSQLV